VRIVKLHSSQACETNRATVREWLRIGPEDTSDRLYWMFAADLLFAVRPSHRGRFAYEGINPAFESLLGISSEEIREMDVSACLSREDARSVCEALHACLAEGAEVRIRHCLALGGPRRTIETTVAPICDAATSSVVRLIGSHRILSEGSLKGAAEGIVDARMNVRLASIQEDIQQRIASDLHDSTCQHLIAASLGLMRIRPSLGDPVSAERLCDEIDASIDEALKEIRAFAYLLYPQDLTIDGLKATIEHYAEGFAARTSLQVSTRIASDVDRLPYEKQRSLLRIVQEALTNVFRHAKATEVEIVVEVADGRVRLTISDDGHGMPVATSRPGTRAISLGVGIPAMRARLQQIGGTLEIRSGPAMRRSGTMLCAVFPHDFVTNRRNRRKATSVITAHTGTQ
jgi:two-component system NarL family sensor kinase